MSEQYKTITQQDADGNDFTCIEVQFTTRGSSENAKWANCAICGLSFKQSEMSKSKGKFYCQKYRHNQEIGEQRS